MRQLDDERTALTWSRTIRLVVLNAKLSGRDSYVDVSLTILQRCKQFIDTAV